MSDVTEGFGVAVEGALNAKAVEPHAGRGVKASGARTQCANCGAPLTGPYCNQCGQKAHVHRTLTAIGHDLMHGVLHLDGKLAHTLPLLAFKPGRLTRRYIEGERAKFVSPMAMLLFSVFAMFAVFQIIGLTVPTSIPTEIDTSEISEFSENLFEKEADELRQRIAELDASGSEDQAQRAELEDNLKSLEDVLEQIRSDEPISVDGEGFDLRDLEITGGTGIEAIDKGVVKKWRENPGLMLYKLQANAYKFSWLLVPISLPFMALLFLWRRGHKAYDHTVFVTYSLSFMSLFFITLSLIAVSPLQISVGWIFAIGATVAPLHLYKHLRYTYGLSRFSTIWRFVVLLFFMIFIILSFVQVLIILGGY